ncbi:MAG: glycosyltransferase family 2 protein [Patescibacteria group bacterium]|nr:glycosyltransferase family 2 protein [Patescibacteria group bacterium]
MRNIFVSVIIPTWNAEKLLKRNLPLILSALPKPAEVIIIENGSTDHSADYLKALSVKDSRIRPIFKSRNLGFIKGCNLGARVAKGEFLVLLNNDVVPQKGFLEPALRHFKNPEIFAVSFNEGQFGWAKLWWRGGFIHHGVGGKGKKAHISGWASGGSAVFRRSIWHRLGGFDEVYQPFYWEDVDLGYRAWKGGWKIVWEPKSLVEHRHESTISRLDKNFVDLVKERNQLIFAWKNINDFWFNLSQPLGISLRISTGPNYLKVFLAAVSQYCRFPKRKPVLSARTDREILKLFQK